MSHNASDLFKTRLIQMKIVNEKERGYEPLLRPPGGGGFAKSVPSELVACAKPGGQ